MPSLVLILLLSHAVNFVSLPLFSFAVSTLLSSFLLSSLFLKTPPQPNSADCRSSFVCVRLSHLPAPFDSLPSLPGLASCKSRDPGVLTRPAYLAAASSFLAFFLSSARNLSFLSLVFLCLRIPKYAICTAVFNEVHLPVSCPITHPTHVLCNPILRLARPPLPFHPVQSGTQSTSTCNLRLLYDSTNNFLSTPTDQLPFSSASKLELNASLRFESLL